MRPRTLQGHGGGAVGKMPVGQAGMAGQTVPDGGQTAGSGITIDHLSPPIPNLEAFWVRLALFFPGYWGSKDDLGGKEDAVVCGSRTYGNRMSKKAMAASQRFPHMHVPQPS